MREYWKYYYLLHFNACEDVFIYLFICFSLLGYADDATGRLVLEFENLSSTIERKNCPREIASYLLYLTRLHR